MNYIDVLPEMEGPGHMTAAIRSYPELGCETENIDIEDPKKIFVLNYENCTF